ncbi:MAG: diaminopimelate epimerase [Myxococcota bacterium]|nr:diaminopimelate epimerase [Myxococcota bacterium]
MILIKSHGLGNDYLVLHASSLPMTPARARLICDRHIGVGGDGVLERLPGQGADYGLRIWNPDGSTAEKSGNGLRIFSRYLVDHCGAKSAHTISVASGVVRSTVASDAVTVEMGRATTEPAAVPCTQPLSQTPVEICGTRLSLTAVGVGNPHCVVFFSPETDLDALPWREWGAALEVHPLFPNRTNVQFARVLNRDTIEMRIWERGAGETSASGSSSCAVATAACLHGLVTPRPGERKTAITLVMPGGELSVTVREDLSLTLHGPAEEVCWIELSPVFLGSVEKVG